MRVGIVTALRAEASCITTDRIPFNHKIDIAEDTAIWFCGIGARAAHHAATELEATGARALISFGVAGALEPGLNPGDLVLPESILSADQTYPVTLAWRNQLQQLLHSAQFKSVSGAIASSTITLTTEQEKRHLAEITGACSVDMESGAIAEVAAKAGIPFIAIRAIIDPVEFSPPAALLSAIRPDGGINALHLATLLLTGSVRISTLLHLAKGMRAARQTLITVIRLAGIQLGREILQIQSNF